MQVYHDFFWYPDPDQRFLIRIRIRIRPNDMDPTGSETLTKLSLKVTKKNTLSTIVIITKIKKINETRLVSWESLMGV